MGEIMTVTIETIMEAVERDDGTGFCVVCRAEVGWVEPDARRVECSECGKPGVFGAELLLLRLVG